jgi:hypothetical protein
MGSAAGAGLVALLEVGAMVGVEKELQRELLGDQLGALLKVVFKKVKSVPLDARRPGATSFPYR